jgi:membrane-associated protease RseP (regulator of RpoE activity)
MEIVGIVAFVLLIAASIALHELGHMVPAKLFGVRVTEYMIGFGPTLWSKVKGETRYGIKAIPLGGYIRMIGMLPPAKPGEAPRSMSTGRFAQLIDDARKQSMSEVGPDDANRVFYKLSVPKRLVIMAGGPVMNLVLAFVLFAIVLVGIGLPEPTIKVGAVVPCVPTATQPTGQPLPSGECPTGTQATPAALAGLQPGDAVLAVDGTSVQAWSGITELVTGRAGDTITVTVEREGTRQEIPVTVAQVERPVVDEAGEPTGEVVPSGFLGVRPEFAYVPQPWTSVPATMWDLTVASVRALISLPVRLYELVVDTLIGGGERDINGPVSVVGVSRLGGEIAAMDEPVNAKFATFLGLAASLNLFLFLFNLLPVLPLDGGHIAGALVEGGRRQLARLFGRPDPGPVDVARLLPVAYVVAGILIAMGVIVIWADIVKPISLG